MEEINTPQQAAMFDHILFEADLPRKGLPNEIKEIDMSDTEFQTTDLSKTMDTWSVSSAGELFFHESEPFFVKDENHSMGGYFKEKHKGIKREEKTKSIHFYNVFEGKEKDYWISYDALFRKGNLVSVDLNEVEEVDQETRKEARAKAREIAESFNKKMNRTTHTLLKPIKFCLGVFLISLHFCGSKLSELHSKL
jgi:SepF-like predicted cell division protein (DUF552 family)